MKKMENRYSSKFYREFAGIKSRTVGCVSLKITSYSFYHLLFIFSFCLLDTSSAQSQVDSCENSFLYLTKPFNHFTNRFILPVQRKFRKKPKEKLPALPQQSIIDDFFLDVTYYNLEKRDDVLDYSFEFNREIEQINLPVLYPYNEASRVETDILNRELEQTRKTQEEDELKARGFKSSYYSGVDQAREFSRVGEYIRNINADPYTTHIPYFAGQIDNLIRNFERDIRNGQKLDSIIEKLRILEGFKKEAQKRIENKKVTYEWWVLFHLRLFILATNYHRFSIKHYSKEDLLIHIRTHEGMKVIVDIGREYGRVLTKLMNRFPKDIIFFSTKDILGYMAFNRMGNGDHFIGISWKDEPKFADGGVYDPAGFLQHDINHMGVNFRNERLIKQVEERINNISDFKKRKKAELAWFIFRHESINQSVLIPSVVGKKSFRLFENPIMRKFRRDMRDMLMNNKDRFMKDYDLKEALPDNVNPQKPKQVENFLKESADILFDILLTVQKHGQ